MEEVVDGVDQDSGQGHHQNHTGRLADQLLTGRPDNFGEFFFGSLDKRGYACYQGGGAVRRCGYGFLRYIFCHSRTILAPRGDMG
jgi:hypothetical protein